MITEGLNININDIEDDDLREKVIDYFKTFKKGKLEDKDLNELDKDSKENGEDSDEGDEENDDSDESVDKLMDMLGEFDDVDDEDDEDPDWDDDDDDPWDFASEANDSDEKDSDKDEKKKEDVKESMVNEGLIRKIKTRKKIRKIKKQMAYLQHKIDNAPSGGDKARWQANLEFIKQSSFDDNGKPMVSKKEQRNRVAKLLKTGKIKAKDIVSRAQMKAMSKDAKEYWKDPKNKDERKKYQKDTKKMIKKYIKDKDPNFFDKMVARAALNKKDVDGDGNVVKKEKITMANGKKKKVITHTGPRGGKFYWPDGAPKDPEHKVYIDHNGKVKECMDLKDYLYELF